MDIKPDYKYLLEYFKEEVIQSRYDHMESRALAFIEKGGYSGRVFLNHSVLNVVMLDYFADIARLKDFEGIEHTNKNKITAFMSYWWVRRKPLQIIGDMVTESEDEEKLVYVNEEFITSFITKDFMYGNSERLMSNIQCQKCVEHIFYHLKYRIFTAQTIELMLMAMETGIEIGKLSLGQ